MQKILTIISAMLLINLISFSDSNAQGYELKFNRAVIVNNIPQLVPAGTVWKVTSIYGEEFDVCVAVKYGSGNYFTKAMVTSIYVDGVFIPSTIRGLNINSGMWSNNVCTASLSGGYNLEGANKTSDPNILPLWLPANTSLYSGGPNTFISVLEFVVQ